MRGKRLQTRLNKLPPGITDESEYYSDIDTPDMLLGLRGHIADLETQMSVDEIANNRLAEYSYPIYPPRENLFSETRDDDLEPPLVEGRVANVIISSQPPAGGTPPFYPDNVIIAGPIEVTVAQVHAVGEPTTDADPNLPAILQPTGSSNTPQPLDNSISAFHSTNTSRVSDNSPSISPNLLANLNPSPNLLTDDDVSLPSVTNSNTNSRAATPQPTLGFPVPPLLLEPVRLPPPVRTQSPLPITPAVRAIMAPSNEEVAAAINDYLRASDEYEDEYKEMVLDYLPPEEMCLVRDKAKGHKEKLANCYHTVRECPVEILAKVGSLSTVGDLKKSYIQFIAKTFEAQHNNSRENTSNDLPRSGAGSSAGRSDGNSVSDSIKADRVNKRADAATDVALKICDELAILSVASPLTHLDLDTLEAKCESAKAQKAEIMPELRNLSKTATDAGLRDQAEKLDDAIDTLSDAQREAIAALHKAKINLGIPISGFQRNPNIPVKAPKFSGDFSSEMDYFSFVKAFDEFTGAARIYSKIDKLQRLKSDCLTDQAKEAVSTCDTFDDAIELLRDLYGKARVLFAHKEREVMKVGKCSTDCMERRTWFITVHNKVKALRKLAKDHDIIDSFHTSKIFDTINSNMTPEDRNLYRKRIVDQMDWDPTLDRSLAATVDRMIGFLNKMCARSGLEVDFAMSCFDSSADILKKVGSSGRDKGRQPDSSHNKDKDKPRRDKDKDKTSTFQVSETHTQQPINQQPSSKASKHAREMTQNYSAPLAPIAAQPSGEPKLIVCALCSNQHTTMAYCVPFQKARAKDRWNMLVLTGGCFRCLRLDAKFEPNRRREWWQAHQAACNGDFICTEGDCGKRKVYAQLHFSICYNHITTNKVKQTEFIETLEPSTTDRPHKFFFTHAHHNLKMMPTNWGIPYYLVHFIQAPSGEQIFTFYDSGCLSAAVSTRAAKLFDITVVRLGPTSVDVAGGQQLINPHGDISFGLELEAGGTETIKALQMDEISSPFPHWDLYESWNYLVGEAEDAGIDTSDFPTVPRSTGGIPVDLMLGIKYLSIHPKPVFSLPSGLTLFRSKLKCSGGFQGILGGPQPAFSETKQAQSAIKVRSLLTDEVQAYHSVNYCAVSADGDFGPIDILGLQPPEYHLDKPECELLESEYENYCSVKCYRMITSDLREFKRVDEIGALMEYRCIKCRNCGKCKQGEEIERQSLVEEAEQNLIESCLTFDPIKKVVTARLPFIVDPRTKLTDNSNIAKKALERQLAKVKKNPERKESVIKAHNKLLLNGHVIPLSELPEDQQKDAMSGGYFIPWNTFDRGESLSTPVRIVFDGSSKTPGGLSLNDCLAKGSNTLSKLLHLMFRFRAGEAAFSCDIQMCYNAVKLDPRDYKYQKYWWCPNVDDVENAIIMIIRTLIYGVKASGNLTIAAIQKIVNHAKTLGGVTEVGAKAIERAIYMDDIFPAFWSVKERDEAAIGVVETLALGQMTVKAITKSGEAPSDVVSSDGETVGIVGYRWKPQSDLMMLDIKSLALGKKKRGVRPPSVEGDVRDALSMQFTKRIITGQVAQIFDPMGIASPITGRLKADLSSLTRLGTDWDEPLPPEFLEIWVSNLKSVQDLSMLEFPRNAFPTGASTFELFVAADASQELAAACVYSRVVNADGKYECRLVAAKTSVANKLTIPKAELKAATMAANLGHIVKQNLGNRVTRTFYVTDSSIVLSWLIQDQRPLQVGVRNAVINIRSLSNISDWFHVSSKLNPADLPTRFVEVKEIVGNSCWLYGQPWMTLPEDDLPLRSIESIQLTAEEASTVNKEIRNSDLRNLVLHLSPSATTKVKDRYAVAQYLIDPASMPWDKLARRMAIIHRCFQIWVSKTWDIFPTTIPVVDDQPVISLSPKMCEDGMTSVFVKTTAEVVKFNSTKSIEAISTMQDGILKFNGRILDDTRPKSLVKLSFDLVPTQFCKPLVDRMSPVAYSVMLYVHSKVTNHGSALECIRMSMEIVYILSCRSLAIEIRENCHHCKRYKVRLLEASLGPLHPGRLAPAPAFYFTQSDLFGPLPANCEHQHRATVKVYGAVFKCMTTLSVWVECMTKYDAGSYLQAYVRFSARFGHVGVLHIDPGSQLVAVCKNAKFSISDLTSNMNGRYGLSLDYKVCDAGSHQAQGQAERSIREIKRIFYATFRGFKLDIMGFSTAFAFISNELNNIPIGLFGRYKNLDSTDFITPSRLLHGRNNQRSPIGMPEMAGPSRLLKQMKDIQEAWWETWDKEWLVGLVPRARGWPNEAPRISVGDIVVFQKTGQEAKLGKTMWRTGRVVETRVSGDNICRSVTLEYKNADEKVFRTTRRSVRTVAVLHPEEDVSLFSKLNEACKAAAIHQLMHTDDIDGGIKSYIIH